MQGGRRGRDNFLGQGDPFADFGGFGLQGSLLSSAFGGRDPFEDPFFTRPFGGSPFGSVFEPSFFGAGGGPFGGAPAGFFERQQPMPQGQPQNNRQRGPWIEELDSDDQNPENGGNSSGMDGMSGNVPYVEHPNEPAEGRGNRDMQIRSEHNRRNIFSQPQSNSFSFRTSSVTYGGANGPYYTKSSTRRSGSDGVTFEEHKEADTSSGKAYHQVSRGLHDKGHTLTRNLNSDGRVDSMQTLHNLNEDELGGFEEAWKGNARKHLPGPSERFTGYDNAGATAGGQPRRAAGGGQSSRVLPSTGTSSRLSVPILWKEDA